MDSTNPTSTWIPLAVVGLVLALRARRVGQDRPLNPQWLWVFPAIILVLFSALIYVRPPHGWGWAMLGGGVLLGVPLGWHRAKLTHIGHDENGQLIIRHSAAALFLLAAVVGMRQLARYELAQAGAGYAFLVQLASEGLMGFALGMIVTFRGELWWRARSLVAAR